MNDTAGLPAATVRDMPAPSYPHAQVRRAGRLGRPGRLGRASRPGRAGRLARAAGWRIVAIALLLGTALPAAAIDYIVEVVLFEHRGLPVIGDDRYWVPLSPGRTLRLGSPEAEAEGFTTIEAPLTLAAEAERMRANGYRVLRHFAWQQPGLDAANAVPIRVNLGERIALWTPAEAAPGELFLPASARERDDRPRNVQTTTLAGTIRVRLGRFLHMETRLAYDDPATGTGYRLDESRKMRSTRAALPRQSALRPADAHRAGRGGRGPHAAGGGRRGIARTAPAHRRPVRGPSTAAMEPDVDSDASAIQ